MDGSEICQRLAEPFDPNELKFKPGAVQGARAMALAYIDARVVMDRLDDVVGVGNWQDSYREVADGSVVCRLRLRLDGEWIAKVDVGGPSEQPDAGDRLKSAYSDALKRAAVKFGIGRYLYRLTTQWVDYDPAKRRFAGKPTLPSWALPKGKARPQAAPAPQESAPARPQNGAPPVTAPTQANGKAPPPWPTTGVQFAAKVKQFDGVLAEEEGVIEAGELIKAVQEGGAKDSLPARLDAWPWEQWTDDRRKGTWEWVRTLAGRFRALAKEHEEAAKG